LPRILVADDNTNIQKMVVLAFQERGIEVIAVGNGEAAVRRIPDANPDLVLADVFMPVRNGYEVCEFVKKDPRFSHIPVILLVGAFDPLDEKEARRVGADGVLKKPFVPPDPLIAMVMSALEKNPKVVAELAKAKEAKEVAASLPLPAAAMENPAMAEPKPLPEFPEPSPEEAAMIYGFGKGVRAIDADETEEEEETTRAKNSKSSEILKDPQESRKKSKTPAAAAPKTPVVAMEEDDEEIFDGSATASDWRRSAADFEVPDNVEANPIYSYGKNFEPITFPSERDVPPKRVRRGEESQDIAGEQAATSSESSGEAKEIPPNAAAADSQAAISDSATNWELTTEEESESQQAVSSTVDAASPLASSTVEEVPAVAAEVAAPVLAAATVQETEQVSAAPQSSSEPETRDSHETSRPGFVARIRGWMDMMSPSSDERSETSSESREPHWMTSLASPAGSSSTEMQNTETPTALTAAETENPVRMAEAESLAENAEPPAVIEPRVETIHEEKFEPAPFSEFEDAQDEPSQLSAVESPMYDYGAVTAQSETAEAAAKNEAPAQEPVREEIRAFVDEQMPQVPAEPPSNWQDTAQGHWSSLPARADDAPGNGDAVAESLPLEPLIGDLHNDLHTDLHNDLHNDLDNDLHEQTAVETQKEPTDVTAWLRQRAQQADSHAEESLPREIEAVEAHHQPFADQPEPSIFEPEPAQAFADAFDQRIPTLPPPNREALSQIPFLMPQPEREPATSEGGNASNAAAVDEVVRRVLEKLQPQLQELLSQGVKPLVENMLQNELKAELHKNEK
jgi:CheY-like chemotaxis protein